MLVKVLKYDLKDIFKGLCGLYCIAIVFAAVTRIFKLLPESVVSKILINITGFLTIILMIGVVFFNVIRVWLRFIKNLYGDESYLTHTLPVEKKTIYDAKFLSTIISIFASVVVILLSVSIAWYTEEGIELLKASLNVLADVYDSTAVVIMLVFFFVFFLETAFIVQAGYTGIILGHKADNRRIEKSVLYGLICYFVVAAFAVAVIFVVALFNNELLSLFQSNEIKNMGVLKGILAGGILYYSVLLAVFWIVDIKLINKGVNVD
ncbi:MAG: hypothetical protein ACI39R_05710 [Lachnospiraceae bacterium]